MDYTALENSIVARLSPLNLAGIETIPLPEHEDALMKPSSGGIVTVAYLSSDFDPSVTTDVVAQPEKITFQIVIQSRKLRGNTGIYNVLKSVKTLLLGWKTITTDKIHFSKAVYDAHENSVWTYHINLTTENLAIEQPDDIPVVIARHITLIDEYYNTIEVTAEMEAELNQGVVTYNGPIKKYWRSPVTSGVELIGVVSKGDQLFQFTARNDSPNDVVMKLGTTLGGNEVLEVPMTLKAGEINTATIEVQYSDDLDTTLYLSSPDWNDASITILITMMEGIH